MGLYTKKLSERDGDQKIRHDKQFDSGVFRKGDRVKLKNGDEGTILLMHPVAGVFLIEFEDLDYGATDQDIVGYAN